MIMGVHSEQLTHCVLEPRPQRTPIVGVIMPMTAGMIVPVAMGMVLSVTVPIGVEWGLLTDASPRGMRMRTRSRPLSLSGPGSWTACGGRAGVLPVF